MEIKLDVSSDVLDIFQLGLDEQISVCNYYIKHNENWKTTYEDWEKEIHEGKIKRGDGITLKECKEGLKSCNADIATYSNRKKDIVTTLEQILKYKSLLKGD